MKHVTILVIAIALVSSCQDSNDPSFTDFSSCDCSPFPHDIVCGVDGRTYLDSCQAQCLKVDIAYEGNCRDAYNDPGDTLKWPIEVVCIPVIKEGDPKEVRFFGDGSVLYQNADGSYFRGTQNLCRCLPGSSLIATPNGGVPIAALAIGDEILVPDAQGTRIECITAIVKVPVPTDHKMIEVELTDGRFMRASPLHPLINRIPVCQLEIGFIVDGSMVVQISWQKYHERYTWDLLPSGDDPLYFVNGVPLRSTLERVSGL